MGRVSTLPAVFSVQEELLSFLWVILESFSYIYTLARFFLFPSDTSRANTAWDHIMQHEDHWADPQWYYTSCKKTIWDWLSGWDRPVFDCLCVYCLGFLSLFFVFCFLNLQWKKPCGWNINVGGSERGCTNPRRVPEDFQEAYFPKVRVLPMTLYVLVWCCVFFLLAVVLSCRKCKLLCSVYPLRSFSLCVFCWMWFLEQRQEWTRIWWRNWSIAPSPPQQITMPCIAEVREACGAALNKLSCCVQRGWLLSLIEL